MRVVAAESLRRVWSANFAAVVVLTLAACAGLPSDEEAVSLSGWSSQFTWLSQRKMPRRTPIQTPNGLTDLGALEGKLIILNFWATWCAPCIKELPSLDRLQARLGGSGLKVVAVSVDRTGIASVGPFYRRLNIAHLAIYADPGQQTAHSDKANINDAPFPLYRMPITYVIAPDGRTIGYLAGAADWDSADSVAFLRRLTQLYARK